MASIMDTLFGVSAERFQQERDAAADAQALQYARLSPIERASLGVQRGAYGLAGALGGALGGTDPELQRRTQAQQILGMIDPNRLETFDMAAKMAEDRGDQQLAFGLRLEGNKYKQEAAMNKATIAQREASATASLAAAARERMQSDPEKVRLAREVALLSGPEGSIEYNTAYASSLQQQITPEKPQDKTEIQKLQEYASTLPKGSPLLAEVQAIIKAKSEAKGTTITNVLPGDKALADIPAFRAGVQRTIEPQLKAVTAADNALENIQDSINTNNFASFRAAQTQFARAISGSGDLSQKELLAAGADPSLLGGTADYLARLFTSTPTLDTQEKIKKTLLAIKKVSTNKAKNEIEAQRKIAYSNPGYDKARVDQALNFSEFSAQPTGDTGGKKSVTRTLKSGKVVTVIED